MSDLLNWPPGTVWCGGCVEWKARAERAEGEVAKCQAMSEADIAERRAAEAERDDLLGALRGLVEWVETEPGPDLPVEAVRARAAIAKVGGK